MDFYLLRGLTARAITAGNVKLEPPYRCKRPVGREVEGDCLLSKEHSGRVWLWTWPELLLWEGLRKSQSRSQYIAWLGVYGSTANRCPGDIWGLDNDGNLLLVELKVWPGRHDPFSRFVQVAQDRHQFAADVLAHGWRNRLQLERTYAITAERLLVQRAREAPSAAPGLLPYASRREALHAWPDLYGRLLRWVCSVKYEALVDSRLEQRRRNGNPSPHFIGFAVMHRDEQPHLRGAWRHGYEALRNVAGRNRVHCRAAVARTAPNNDVIVAPTEWQTSVR